MPFDCSLVWMSGGSYMTVVKVVLEKLKNL